MKHIFLFAFLQACIFFSYAQSPVNNLQSAEMKQMIAELKKEIASLESDIKQAEKDDPEAVASMKTQLSSYKTMLAAFDKSKPAAQKTNVPATTKKTLPQTLSPITPVYLRQPVVAASPQDKGRFFWYRGKKINDSTLITKKGTIVQYSKKRHQLIVQPEEKKDSFATRIKEIVRGEQRKRELIDRFDKMKNGFIYYPYLATSISIYDDLTARFSDAVKNTIAFDPELPVISSGKKKGEQKALYSFEHVSVLAISKIQSHVRSIVDEEATLQWVLQQLDEARKKSSQLTSVQNFSAPPSRQLGTCASCDTSLISRQRKLDSDWIENYHRQESDIMQQAFSAMRMYNLVVGEESAELVNDKFNSILNLLFQRIEEKDKTLIDKYGDNFQYLTVISQVILGHERQRQLLGNEDAGSNLLATLTAKVMTAYWKYFDEQVGLKNHDFVLNVPFHFGMFRQMALLGADDGQSGGVAGLLDRIVAYNRFALTMELDFVWQRGTDAEFNIKATGKMETKEKIYSFLYPDGCSFRIMSYTTDLNNKKFEDITLPMKVTAGVKTVREDNDKLKDYPYQGPPEYAFRFPDSRIDFCSNAVPDTLFLAIIGGDEAVAARAAGDMQNIGKAYTIDMLMYAGQVLINEDVNQQIEGTQDAGNKILGSISGFVQQAPPESTIEKLKMQYEGYVTMDDLRKKLEGAFSSKKAKILFNANNRSTVLTDTYIDTKRKLEDDVEIKKGQFHLRMVHEPMK